MRVSINKVGAVGLVLDRDDITLPPEAWTAGSNVRFEHEAVKAAFGWAAVDITSLATAVLQAMYLRVPDGTRYYVYAADTGADGIADAIFAFDGATETDITGAFDDTGAAAEDSPQIATLHGNVVVTNGVTSPVYWDGDAVSCAVLPFDSTHDWSDYDGLGATLTAKAIRSYRQFLVALDLTDAGTRNPRLMLWSEQAQPGSLPASWAWNDPTNDAGRTELAETQGHIVDGLQLGDAFIVYKEDAVYSMQYVGGEFVQQIYPISRSRGMLAPNCAAEANGVHFVLGQRDVYMFNGQGFDSIADGRVRRALYGRLDEGRKHLAFAAHNIGDNEVWFHIPTDGSTGCEEAFTYNYLSGQWSHREIPSAFCAFLGADLAAPVYDWDDEADLQWDSESEQAWVDIDYSSAPSKLFSGADGIYEMDTTDTGNGAALTKWVQRDEIMLGDQDSVHTVMRIRPRGKGTVTISVGTQARQEAAVNWRREGEFTFGVDRKLDVRATGPYHAIKISGTGYWEFYGADVEYVFGGQR